MPHLIRSLAFAICPSPETNDHELRILVDGDDILARVEDTMGLDPPDFFEQPALLCGGPLLIAGASAASSAADTPGPKSR